MLPGVCPGSFCRVRSGHHAIPKPNQWQFPASRVATNPKEEGLNTCNSLAKRTQVGEVKDSWHHFSSEAQFWRLPCLLLERMGPGLGLQSRCTFRAWAGDAKDSPCEGFGLWHE